MHTTFSKVSLVLCICSTLPGKAATTHYVNIANTAPATPFTTWQTAATNIQDAIDAAVAGDEVVVTNGVYATGGRAVFGNLTNRIVIDKAVTVRSVNGPSTTVIEGYQVPGTTNGDAAIRCVYMSNGAVLSGFTVTKGGTLWIGSIESSVIPYSGGGIWCESASAIVTNCVVITNSALVRGGGICQGTVNHCILRGNFVLGESTVGTGGRGDGGGAYDSSLNNCLIMGNFAARAGGGVGGHGTLNNCTVVNNLASVFGGGLYACNANNCILYYNSIP